MEHDWETSEKKCLEVGMHLITVGIEEESTWINTYLQQAGLGDDVASIGMWIGYKGKIYEELGSFNLSSFDKDRKKGFEKHRS